MPDLDQRDTLVHLLATELDKPSIYMGGPSLPSRRKAEKLADIALRQVLDDLRAEGDRTGAVLPYRAADMIEQRFGGDGA